MESSNSSDDVDVAASLASTLTKLKYPLTDNGPELDRFFADISKARRAATITLSKRTGFREGDSPDSFPHELRTYCQTLILRCPEFILKYLEKSPLTIPTQGESPKDSQRRQYITKTVCSTLDSSIYLAKLLKSERKSTWKQLDRQLQECIRLLHDVQPAIEKCATTADTDSARLSYYVRISNLYFAQHLDMLRDAEPKDYDHLKSLKRAVDVLSDVSTSEKLAGSYAMKLDRVADFMKHLGHESEAQKALLTLFNQLISQRVLQGVAWAAATRTMRLAWSQNDETRLLAKTISSLLRLKGDPLQMCAKLLERISTAEERGALLEYFLIVMKKRPKELTNMESTIFQQLMEVYDATCFPIRRLRAICNFLQLTGANAGSLALEEARNALAITNSPLVLERSADRDLVLYCKSLQSFLASTVELLEDHPRIELLKPHLGAWQDIISDISEYEGLSKSIDDIAALLKLLHAVASFLDMKGFGKTRVAALRIITDINAIMRDRYDLEEITDDYCLLASQYLELGYSGKAGLALDKARCAISDSGLSVLASPKLQVEYSRYFHTIGDVHKAEESLVQAHAAITERLHTGEPQAIDTEEMLRLTVSAFTAYSKTYLEQGKPHEAMVYAKRALRVLTRIWKREERRQLQQQSSTFSRNSGGNEESSALLPAGQEESNAKSGPALWSLIRPMFYSLEHLSNIYAHVGMFQDTIYYAEQAQKVAENSNSKNLNTEGLLLLSSAWHRAGVTDKATTYLQQASSFGSTINETQCLLLLKCRLAKMYELQGDIESELKAYAEAEAMLKRITAPSYIAEIDRVVDPALILEAKMSKLTITKGMAGTAIKPPTARKAITTKKVASVIRPPKTRTRKDQPVARGAPRTRKQEATSTKSAAVSSSCNQCLPLESMKGMLMRQKADAYLSRSLLEEAKVCLSEASSIAHTVSDAAQQHLANARQLFHQGLQLLTADAVYSVVQDSTISFPALTAAGKSTETAATTKAVELKKGAGPNTRGTSTVRKTALSWIELLKQAQSHLHEAYTLAVRVSSSRTIQSIASFMNVASLLLSTAGISKIKAIHPSISVSSFELAKALNLCWERDLARLEASQVPTKEADMKWPEVANQKLADNDVTTLCTVTANFQKEFIDIIPSSWTVVSIAVSDNKHELLLTKLEAGHSPFVLRLPLGRNSSRDADEEVFDFQQGKAELLRIIEAANNSAHGARDVSGREAKISWWAERDELNERLEELLQNMENVWLGGFRGMFSQKLRRKELLARFQKTFQNILDKHLPSRQKTGKRTKAPSKVSLEPRILELFVGIGDPFCPEADLDEPLMDLLYFVVDILQFQGEHNAYDEIDFDSMVLETLDALRCYHQAEAECSETDARRHTILILDQELHSFPWESLPCMQGHAVSRLPSIACLRDRILAQQGTEARPEGHYVSASSIAYILNPGQDLKTTQATFSQELQSQPLWEGIIQRRPEEAEIKDMLENKDLYLYFGHGSGAQYIRSKTIKKLTKCATTFLMGCSSASLTEVGEFSPYGPPMSYMLAGSPAVVGTLWDVTDKDIDRFAAKTFEEWGLFKNEEVEEVVVQKTPGRKGKRRANEAEEARPQSRQKVSLVEAVALGRSACNYRYLTAAAAVVYGVPVYIKE